MCGSGAVVCSLSLLIRWAQRARCQAETPLIGLFRFLRPALGPDRKPLLIGIDGADGVGKSSLASWLGWQLGAPALHLDLYLLRDGRSLKWRTDELKLLVQARLGRQQPLIVEGITLLDVLDQIGATRISSHTSAAKVDMGFPSYCRNTDRDRSPSSERTSH